MVRCQANRLFPHPPLSQNSGDCCQKNHAPVRLTSYLREPVAPFVLPKESEAAFAGVAEAGERLAGADVLPPTRPPLAVPCLPRRAPALPPSEESRTSLPRRRTAFPVADELDNTATSSPGNPSPHPTPPTAPTPPQLALPPEEASVEGMTHIRIHTTLGHDARRLALEISGGMQRAHGDNRLSGLGLTLRLLALHHSDLRRRGRRVREMLRRSLSPRGAQARGRVSGSVEIS